MAGVGKGSPHSVGSVQCCYSCGVTDHVQKFCPGPSVKKNTGGPAGVRRVGVGVQTSPAIVSPATHDEHVDK